MFKSQQPLVLFITLLLFSCGAPKTNNTESETEEDLFLNKVDSVLSIADTEIENIIHHNIEDEKEHQELINTINRLNSIVTRLKYNLNEKESVNIELIESNDSLILVNYEKDDLIESQKYFIKNLEEKIKYKDLQHLESTKQYEAIVYRLEDSLSTLNDSINNMTLFIMDNVRQSKRGGY